MYQICQLSRTSIAGKNPLSNCFLSEILPKQSPIIDLLTFILSRSVNQGCNAWKPVAVPTKLRKDPQYSRYYNTLTRLLLLGIAPFVLLTYFNYKIYYGMRLPSMLEQNIQRSNINGVRPEVRRNQENEAAKILIGIVAVFIVCHTLRVTIDVYEMIYIEKIISCNKAGKRGAHLWVLILNAFSSAMVALNSSVNMIIYGLIKPNIRQHIFRFKRKQCNQNQDNKSEEGNIFELNNLLTIPRTPNGTTFSI